MKAIATTFKYTLSFRTFTPLHPSLWNYNKVVSKTPWKQAVLIPINKGRDGGFDCTFTLSILLPVPWSSSLLTNPECDHNMEVNDCLVLIFDSNSLHFDISFCYNFLIKYGFQNYKNDVVCWIEYKCPTVICACFCLISFTFLRDCFWCLLHWSICNLCPQN